VLKKSREPRDCIQGMNYLKEHGIFEAHAFPGTDWIQRAAETMLGNMVKRIVVERVDKGYIKNSPKYRVITWLPGPPWRIIHRIYTHEDTKIAGRLWRVKRSLCSYEECEEPMFSGPVAG
jgi:hypothetical protein